MLSPFLAEELRWTLQLQMQMLDPHHRDRHNR